MEVNWISSVFSLFQTEVFSLIEEDKPLNSNNDAFSLPLVQCK